MQVVSPAADFPLEVIDLAALTPEEREAEVQRRVRAEATAPFDLAAGPLLRATLLRLEDEAHVVLFTMHHIVSDGWSTGVLVREISALYEAYARGEAARLPELPVQYADFAAWQRAYLSGEVLDAQIAYWRERLAGAPPVLELPTDFPRPAVAGTEGATVSFALSAETTQALRGLARAEGATLFMVLLAGFQALLARYSQEDVVVGSPVAGRNRVEVEGLIGFFVNTLVLRGDLSGDPSVRALLGRVRESVLGAHAHQDLPFERLVDELSVERSLAHTPLFQAMFTLEDVDVATSLHLGDVAAERLETGSGATKFDLTLGIAERGDHLTGRLEYRTDLFEAATVERMAEHLSILLAGMAADAERRVSELDVLGENERAQVLEAWNDTAHEYPADLCIHQLFERQVARTPDGVALIFGGETLRYAELDRRADRLANALRRRGVGPEVRVALCMERSVEMMVGVLGVLKAGGAYVPLDPASPAERLAGMIHDAGAPVVLTQEGLAGLLAGAGAEVVRLDVDWPAIARESDDAPAAGVGPDPEGLAYVIFTSGSTGTPKGVGVSHRSAVSHLWWVRHMVLRGVEILPATTPLFFDASLKQVVGPLLHGAAVWMLDGDTVRDPAALLRSLEGREAVALNCVPSLWRMLLEREGAEHALRGLRALLLGGEALSASLLEQTFRRFPGVEVWNLYGPTETTVNAVAGRVEPGGAGAIGRPVGNARAYVLDAHGHPVPVRVPGELYVGGAGVARGYVGRPDLTAERFVPDPFAAEPGARAYRTGDRVRWRTDGELEFLGRVDHQVKVRGFRIEPGEIEAMLAEHPQVREAVVLVREDVPGDPRLVAYLTAEGEAPAPAELRAHLKVHLPDYMVPGAFVALDALPLTPNGKVDRKALPAPSADAGVDSFTAPRTPSEEILAGIWAAILGVEQVGVHESFFALGGHSLLATRVISRIREAFGVELPLRALFETPTVAELAARVDGERHAGGTQAPPLERVSREAPLPLSFAQQRLWFIDQLEPGSATYNMPAALRLRGALDVNAFARSLTALVERHETLRTTFQVVDEEPVQVVAPAADLPLEVVALAAFAPEEREVEVQRRVRAEAATPFDLAAGPLLRSTLLRLDEDEHVVLFTMHHIVSDGWSTGVLVREVSALYEAFARGEAPRLPELPVQYADFAAWQRAWLSGDVLDTQIAYWRERLAGAPPVLELPTDFPRPAVASTEGATVTFALSAETTRALRGLARAEGATLFMVLLTGFQALLSRYTGQEDVVVGSPIAGRNRVEVEGLIGFFVNTLVLRGDLSGEPSVRALLGRVREAVLGAHAHQDLPFERLVDELSVERSLAHTPLFQVVLTLEEARRESLHLGDVQAERLETGSATAKFDLHLSLSDEGERLSGRVEYRTDLFEAATVERMAAHVSALLAGMAAQPQAKVAELEVLSESERTQVLEVWNDTAREYPRELSHQLFQAQAEHTPHAVALVHQGESLSYVELNRRANRLANHLRGLGVGPEVRVGVCLERTPELIVALLGILKAGGAYVPLDPAYPAERLAYMVEDSGAWVIVTQERFADRLSDVRLVRVDADRERIAAESDVAPTTGVMAENLSHVIFTSGSTGRPKGVMIRHGSVAVLLHWLRENVSDEERSSVLFSTSINFDVSVAEIFGTLCWGGTLVLVENALELPSVADRNIVYASMVPTAAAELLRSGGIPASVRTLNLGGEALP
ncbi:MAG: amino acid adenylation domain-containing protein, partial [Gemmatimonadetes bacterium]|nr:amino acid adenylation domain-containing protein [Gemmatimonadota bacterium]